MQDKVKDAKNPSAEKLEKSQYWVYILKCSGDRLYTGYSSNIVKRYYEHITGTGKAKFTRAFKPEKISACWMILGAKGEAMKVEALIKKQSRSVKDGIIRQPMKLARLIKENISITAEISPFKLRQINSEIKKIKSGENSKIKNPFSA